MSHYVRMAHDVSLRTERLLLSPVVEDHLGDFLRLYSDPQTMRWLGQGKPLTVEETEVAVRRMARHWRDHGFGMFAVHLMDGSFVGRCGLCRLDRTERVELGYTLLSEHWGHGYATEAAQSCLRFAFDELGLDEVVAITTLANEASQRVMRKCGLVFQGTAWYYRSHVLVYGATAGKRSEPNAL